jgi:hypothetical protein
MLTGLAARNVMGADYDIWKVNTAPNYLESGAILDVQDLAGLQAGQPHVPHTHFSQRTVTPPGRGFGSCATRLPLPR